MAQHGVDAAGRGASYHWSRDPRGGGAGLSSHAARAAYAALFMVLLPLLLVLWSRGLDAVLPLPPLHAPGAGTRIMALGALFGAWAVVVLWTRGNGLPASPFPPQRLVTTGPYRLVAHPIYLAAVLIALGASLAAGSPGGVWIVTPVLAAAAAAWVLGFERDFTRGHFGTLAEPLLRIAEGGDDAPRASERVAVWLFVLLPWFVLYEAIELLGAPPDAFVVRPPVESAIPVLPWTEAMYALTYPLVGLAPLLARTRTDLRRFARDGLWSMALILPLYLLLPLAYPARPIPGDGPMQWLMRADRIGDGPATAFPAYHVTWAMIAARVYVARWSRARPLMVVLVTAIAASCVTTGMHGAIDVVGGIAAYFAIVKRGAIWASMREWSERRANSWREWRVGPVRFINHGLYAGIGAAAGVGIAVVLGGRGSLGPLLVLTAAAIVGAALWAQLVEGSAQLLRPYGYFGAVLGVLVAGAALALTRDDAWLVLAAFAAGCTVTTAFGRVRCLVQGCCHGSAAPARLGICYAHPASRVVRLGGLAGVPLHPTQLYSILWCAVTFAALLRLWTLAAPLPFIVGAYFVLQGLGRFVEEHFRGEPQTRVVAGLRLYQWLAIASIVLGAVVTTLRGPNAPIPTLPPANTLVTLLLVGVITAAAYGLDFPASTRRFSRLA